MKEAIKMRMDRTILKTVNSNNLFDRIVTATEEMFEKEATQGSNNMFNVITNYLDIKVICMTNSGIVHVSINSKITGRHIATMTAGICGSFTEAYNNIPKNVRAKIYMYAEIIGDIMADWNKDSDNDDYYDEMDCEEDCCEESCCEAMEDECDE
jgi:hypothetical protein